ncbi:MAG: anti-sigma factor, partial [Deltaproteobacteria bacterium]|nr:anti-sigma factor [Deltaproteobacteria bacterium]
MYKAAWQIRSDAADRGRRLLLAAAIVFCWAGGPVWAQPAGESVVQPAGGSPAPAVAQPAGPVSAGAGGSVATAPAESREGSSVTEVEKAERPAGDKLVAPKEAGAYDLMIRDLNEKVSELKEKIFRSKARLILLKETVLHGAISGSKAILIHRNEMGSSFRLEQVLYSLDGAPIYQKTDKDGGLDEREEFEIFHGAIVPGNHNISVYLEYRGHGYGIFSYLEGYVFKIRSSFAFTAEEGKAV